MTAATHRGVGAGAVAYGAGDATHARELAEDWVAEHRPGRRVAETRTHSTLYRGPGDLSTRVAVRLVGDPPPSETTLLVRDRQGAVSVTEFPDDPLLPTLAEVLRPDVGEALLRSALPPSDELAGGDAAYAVEVVHHPRDGACVLRLRLGGADAYAKVYPGPEDAEAAADRLRAVGAREVVGPGGQTVRLPRVLAVSPDLRTTVLESLTPAGAPDAAHTGRAPVGRAAAVPALDVTAVAGALRAWHAHAPHGRLPRVPATTHLDRVRAEQQLVGTAWPDLAERVDTSLGACAAVLGDFGPFGGDPPVLCHGDFTPGQLVRVPGGLGLLDLDTVCLGDPAADIGRYLAYASVRRGPKGTSAPAAVSAELLAAYRAPAGEGDSTSLVPRVWAHRRLNLVLIALRAARRFKAARTATALSLLDLGDPIPRRMP